MKNNTHAHSIFLKERNLLKTPFPACINLMNRDVFLLLCSNENNLRLNNLSLYSLRSYDRDLVNLFLFLRPYFLARFLDSLGPYYLGYSSN